MRNDVTQYVEQLDAGLDSQIAKARAQLVKVRGQVERLEAQLDDLADGVLNVRPSSVEVNHWVLLQPFMQATRVETAEKVDRLLNKTRAAA